LTAGVAANLEKMNMPSPLERYIFRSHGG
jgi:hypothetical protein